MNEFITVDENNNIVIKRSNSDFKEEIKMSLLNMAMNIGHFNIKVSIKKDEEMKRNSVIRKFEHEQRMNKVLEDRRNLLFMHNMHNFIV